MVKKFWQLPQNCWVLISLLGIAWLLSACANSGLESEAALVEPTVTPTVPLTGRGAGGTLRLLYWQAPELLNPHLVGGNKELEVSRITYEPLASFDQEGELVPILAAEIPSLENGGVADDGTSVTWKLKQGVKWSDGQSFTANDVRFTYEFIANPEVNSPSLNYYQTVKNVEVVDDYTVKVNFEDVNPAWAQPFVGLRGVIIPRHVFEPYNGPQAREAPANWEPVGTGPYRLVKRKPEEVLFLGTKLIETIKIMYEPNPVFREADKPYFSRIELKGGGTVDEAAWLVLKAGEVDFAYNLQTDPATLEKLEAGGKGYIIANFGARVEQIALNRADPAPKTAGAEVSNLQVPHPFFSDKRVRQAFAYAVDREAIAKLYGPTGRPTSNNLVAPANYASPNTFYEYDLDKARTLLAEAGWLDTNGDGVREKDGVKLSVVSLATVGSVFEQSQAILQQGLEAIGVEVRIKLIDSDTYYGPGSNPDSSLYFHGDLQEYDISTSSPDPAPYMRFWSCEQIPEKRNNWSGLNIGRWCNPDYDALLRQADTVLDPDERQEIFIQLNDIQIEDVALINTVHLAQVSGVSNTLTGLDPTPWDGDLWNLKDWR